MCASSIDIDVSYKQETADDDDDDVHLKFVSMFEMMSELIMHG